MEIHVKHDSVQTAVTITTADRTFSTTLFSSDDFNAKFSDMYELDNTESDANEWADLAINTMLDVLKENQIDLTVDQKEELLDKLSSAREAYFNNILNAMEVERKNL